MMASTPEPLEEDNDFMAMLEGRELPLVPIGRISRRFNVIENESGVVLLENATLAKARRFSSLWADAGSSLSYVEVKTYLRSGHILGDILESSKHEIEYQLTYLDAPTLCSPYRVDVVQWGQLIESGVTAAHADALMTALLGAMIISLGDDFPRFFDESQSHLAGGLANSWGYTLGAATVQITDPLLAFAPQPAGVSKRRPAVAKRTARSWTETRRTGVNPVLYQEALLNKGIALVDVSTLDVVFVGAMHEAKERILPSAPCKQRKADDGSCSFHFTYGSTDGRWLHYRSEKRAAVDYRVVKLFGKAGGLLDMKDMQQITDQGQLGPFENVHLNRINSDYTVISKDSGAVLAMGSQKQLMTWFSAAKNYGYKTADMRIIRNFDRAQTQAA